MTGPQMRLITSDGVIAAAVADETQRSLVGQHANVVAQFLATGDTKPLKPFEGVVIADRQLLTDPDALEAWAIR